MFANNTKLLLLVKYKDDDEEFQKVFSKQNAQVIKGWITFDIEHTNLHGGKNNEEYTETVVSSELFFVT